jgi:hypothetical protein
VDPNGGVTDGDTTPFPTATNNVQQVTINNPVAGKYTIRVRGISVSTQAPGAAPGSNPRQDFALVVSNGYGLNVPAPLFSILTPLTRLTVLTPLTRLTPITLFTPFTILSPTSLLTPLTVVTPLTPLTIFSRIPSPILSPILSPIISRIPSVIPSFLPPISRIPTPIPTSVPSPIRRPGGAGRPNKATKKKPKK